MPKEQVSVGFHIWSTVGDAIQVDTPELDELITAVPAVVDVDCTGEIQGSNAPGLFGLNRNWVSQLVIESA